MVRQRCMIVAAHFEIFRMRSERGKIHSIFPLFAICMRLCNESRNRLETFFFFKLWERKDEGEKGTDMKGENFSNFFFYSQQKFCIATFYFSSFSDIILFSAIRRTQRFLSSPPLPTSFVIGRIFVSLPLGE